MMKIYIWFDKVDKRYMTDTVMISDRERDVCRGYIKAFMDDRRMNPAEYELCSLGSLDIATGAITPNFETIDPRQVYAKDQSDYDSINPVKHE